VVASRHHVPAVPPAAEGRQAPPVLEHRGDPPGHWRRRGAAARALPGRDQRQPARGLAQDHRGVGTIRGIARKFGVHRRLVREAVVQALPPDRKPPQRQRPKLAPAIPFIEAILAADRRAPRKQRHTAHRIFHRLQAELPTCRVAESTVREYVRDRKRALGLLGRATCVPQSYAWGSEGQADWYEAVAELGGERQPLQVFALRSMASGGAFHRAYTHATQQAFLEAHEAAFHYFGGVFHHLLYDNLPLAVKRILRGREHEQTTRFIAFRSHWRFAATFCTPGEGHEKGGIEGVAGYFRRNHWVPIPEAPDLAARPERAALDRLRGRSAPDHRRPGAADRGPDGAGAAPPAAAGRLDHECSQGLVP
jgi:transposase